MASAVVEVSVLALVAATAEASEAVASAQEGVSAAVSAQARAAAMPAATAARPILVAVMATLARARVEVLVDRTAQPAAPGEEPA
jgi:hypothetical protein